MKKVSDLWLCDRLQNNLVLCFCVVVLFVVGNNEGFDALFLSQRSVHSTTTIYSDKKKLLISVIVISNESY
jgi:hypothetical protein